MATSNRPRTPSRRTIENGRSALKAALVGGGVAAVVLVLAVAGTFVYFVHAPAPKPAFNPNGQPNLTAPVAQASAGASWTPDAALLDKLDAEVAILSKFPYHMRPPAGCKMKPLPAGKSWEIAARLDAGTGDIYAIIVERKTSATPTDAELQELFADAVQGVRNMSYQGYSPSPIERGTIGGLTAARLRWSAKRPGVQKKVNGLVYLVFDWPFVVRVNAEDVEPYQAETLKIAEAAALTVRREGPPPRRLATDEPERAGPKPTIVKAEPRPWTPDETLLGELEPAIAIHERSQLQIRLPRGYSRQELPKPPDKSAGIVNGLSLVGPRRSNASTALIVVIESLPPTEALVAGIRSLEQLYDMRMRESQKAATNVEQTEPDRGQIDRLNAVRGSWYGDSAQIGRKVHGFVCVALDGPVVVEVLAFDTEPFHANSLKLAEAVALTLHKADQ